MGEWFSLLTPKSVLISVNVSQGRFLFQSQFLYGHKPLSLVYIMQGKISHYIPDSSLGIISAFEHYSNLKYNVQSLS